MAKFFNRVLPILVISFCMALLLVFMLAVFSSSVLRYALNVGSVKLEDLIGYTFGALILLSVLAAFFDNKHVRVDMFTKLRTTFGKPLPSILSSLPFLAIMVLSLPAVGFSLSVFEGSRQPNGLGGFFILKSLLPVSFGLIAIFLCFSQNDDQK